ncbi:MAG TPA: hypothetical protein VHW60_16700 [Caulobacteraceae bacterium]|nr:hypothetical protein [Caulobacteraceae bacterium]
MKRWNLPRLLLGWSPVIAIVAALIGAPALTQALHRAAPPRSYVEASGYGAVISGLLAPRGWLVGYIDEASDNAPTQVVAIDAKAPPQLLGFYAHSYLAQDIRANNPALWLFNDGRLIGSDPSAHRLPRPFADERAWRGDLSFAVSAMAMPVLQGDGGVELDLQPPPVFAPDMPPPTVAAVDLFAAGPHAAQANIVDVSYHGQTVASFQVVGQSVVVKAEADPDVTTVVAGQVVSPRAEGAAYLALSPGQQVLFRTAQGERMLRLIGKGVVLSQYLPFAMPNRTFSPELSTFSHPLVDSLNDWMAEDPNVADGLEHLPIVTTIDEPLNAAVQAALDDQVKKVAVQVNDSSFRAAATVIDAQTGDILALGDSSGDTGAGQNQNFVRLPIGSAAKIPFSAAILNWRPDLASLNITGAMAPTFSTLLGVDLCSPTSCDPALRAKRAFHEEAVGLGHVDFCNFIEHSSNKFGTSLLLLASSPDPTAAGTIPARETYSLDGVSHTTLPPLMFPVKGSDDSGTLVGAPPVLSSRLGWIGQLSDLFDLPLVERTSGVGDAPGSDLGDYNLSVWSALIGDHTVGLNGFKQVSPERESFALNTVADIRNDYLTLILGGGRSRWTTVKLAEAFARVVMDRRVEARLYDPKGAVTDPRPLMRPEARNPLLQALQTVPAHGTAMLIEPSVAALQAQAGAGEEIRIYAKTGTPTIQEVRRSPLNEAIDFLIHQGKVVMGPGQRLMVAGADRSHDPVRILSADRAIDARLAGLGVSAAAVVDGLGRQSGYAHSTLAQGLLGLDPDISWTHDGGVFAFVIGRYRVGAPAEQPERAFAVAINVQQRQEGGANPALLASKALLDGALGRMLLQGEPPNAGKAAPFVPPSCPVGA